MSITAARFALPRQFVASGFLAFAITVSSLSAAQADEAMDAYYSGDYATARVDWSDRAYRDPYAAFNLAILYDTGRGVDYSYKTAFKWYLQAASHARENTDRELKLQASLSLARLAIRNHEQDFYDTANKYVTDVAMNTGAPEALRMRGLLMELKADSLATDSTADADTSMKYAWALLRVATERGSPYAKKEATRVWGKVDDKKGAENMLKLVHSELQRNGVK